MRGRAYRRSATDAGARRAEASLEFGRAPTLIEPSTEQILRFCAEAPDRARLPRGRGAPSRRDASPALADGEGELTALCHLGTNLVPSGAGCGAFAGLAAKSGARMLIGEAGAVSDLWEAARKKLPRPRLDRPGQPVYAITEPPEPAGRASGRRTSATSTCSCPSCAAAHHEELGSTRCVGTRADSAGAPGPRSRRGARGCGPRTA